MSSHNLSIAATLIPVIFGLPDQILTYALKEFISSTLPLGFILFSRNFYFSSIENLNQAMKNESLNKIKNLIEEIRNCYPSYLQNQILIGIDQEGGKVDRLQNLKTFPANSAKYYGDRAKNNIEEVTYQLLNDKIAEAKALKALGFNFNTIPVADLWIEAVEKHTSVIGSRAFSENPLLNAVLCQAYIKAYNIVGIDCVIKHIPGHGRATLDTHYFLSQIYEVKAMLQRTDLLPFKVVKGSKFAMVAHIQYMDIDSDNPATFSKKVIDFIRIEVESPIILMSDAIEMGALNGEIEERAKYAKDAGCDIILHCNGDLEQMQKVAQVLKGAQLPNLLNSLIPFSVIDANLKYLQQAYKVSTKEVQI